MYQKVTLIGYLGRDPEMRYLPDGTAVCTLSVATSERWTDASGAKQERTTWFRVACWKQLAEIVSKYLSKGRQVYIEGTLSEPKPYQARDGQWRASLDVRATVIKFLGSGGAASGPRSGDTEEIPLGEGEEEIPF